MLCLELHCLIFSTSAAFWCISSFCFPLEFALCEMNFLLCAVKKLPCRHWRPAIGILKEHLMYSTATPSLNRLLILDIWRSFTTDIKARFKFPFSYSLKLELTIHFSMVPCWKILAHLILPSEFCKVTCLSVISCAFYFGMVGWKSEV